MEEIRQIANSGGGDTDIAAENARSQGGTDPYNPDRTQAVV